MACTSCSTQRQIGEGGHLSELRRKAPGDGVGTKIPAHPTMTTTMDASPHSTMHVTRDIQLAERGHLSKLWGKAPGDVVARKIPAHATMTTTMDVSPHSTRHVT